MAEYVLGSSDREIERLAYQHEVWFDDTSNLWKKAGIGINSRVADLGCGPGFCTKALARLVGNEGHVFAVDMSEKFSALMNMETRNVANITFHRNDVTATEIDDEAVDVVFSRWLYCFLAEPEKGIAEAKRILKPCGRLVVLDYFNYLAADVFPTSQPITALFEAFSEDVGAHGGTWDIGGELPALMVEAGFSIESLDPICRIGRPDSREWRWVEYFTEVSAPRLVESGIWTEQQKSDFDTEWKKASENPASFFFTPPMIGIIATLDPDSLV